MASLLSRSSITDISTCVILEFPEGTVLSEYGGRIYEYILQKKKGSGEGISIQSFRNMDENRALVQLKTAAGWSILVVYCVHFYMS